MGMKSVYSSKVTVRKYCVTLPMWRNGSTRRYKGGMKAFLVYPRAQIATNARDFSDAPDPINPEFPICAYPSPKSIAAPLLGSSSDRHGSFQVASWLVSALPPTSVVCFPPPACLAADTYPP